MKASDASVIIPAFGPAHLLDACLEAVEQAEPPREILVWDNGVRPSIWFESQARLLGGEGNWGYAVACNRAALEASGDPLVFLNCDTEVELGWLDALVGAFDDPTVAVAGSRLFHPDGQLQHAGIEIRLQHFAVGAEIKEDLPTRDVDGVTGACMAVRRSVWEEVGGFDEGYFMGYDDVDFCIRVRRAGHRIRYVRESRVMHHESATGPERWSHLAQNIDRLQRWVA